MDQARLAIVGGAGRRAQYYLRIAAAMPQRFAVCGMVVRDPEKARQAEARWSVSTHRDITALLQAQSPEFAVVSVAHSAAASVIAELADHGVPVLCETPPGDGVDALAQVHRLTEDGAKVQVAEQYILQPMHAARLHLACSGKLGAITQAQVSAAHGHHGMSLIRHLLGVNFEDVTITAMRFTSPLIARPRAGDASEHEQLKDSVQHIAWLDFDGRLGVLDFTGDQYSSWVRSPRVLVRGKRGEINNTMLRYLRDAQTPIEAELRRADAGHDGNLEGYHHQGMLCEGEWVYRNPFAPARLSDEEIAIAGCMWKMAEHVRGGPAFYPVAQAAQDKYLADLMNQAIDTGLPVRSTPQAWAAVQSLSL